MKRVELLQDVEADEVLDSRLNILEFVPLNTTGAAGENQGSELRFQTWALVLNTRKGQFLIWNKNNNSCRISRILIPCHWKDRVTSDGGPLVALWSMRQQLILLDVPTGMAYICPSPPQLVARSRNTSLILSTCALGSSLDNFQLVAVYGEPVPRCGFVVTPVIFDSTTGMWRIKSCYVPPESSYPSPNNRSVIVQECISWWWPGYSRVAGGFLHVVFRDLYGSIWISRRLRYDLEGDEWTANPGGAGMVKWSQGQVNYKMSVRYSRETGRIEVQDSAERSLPQALVDLQPPLKQGVANITLRSDGVFTYAFFTHRGCLQIVYVHDVEAGTWCSHSYQRLRDLKLELAIKSQPPHDEENASNSKWSTLPSDLLQDIVQRMCTGRDVVAVSMVCHNWHNSLKTFTKLDQEPILVFWNNKNNELCFFRSDKGWSRIIRGKNFIYRAPLLIQGPLLISWSAKILYINNILRSSSVQVMAPLDTEYIIKVGCISQEKLLVIFSSSYMVTPAVLNFTSSTLSQWQVGNPRTGLSCLSQVETIQNWRFPSHQDDEYGRRDCENVILLGPYAYFMLNKRVGRLQKQVVFQYNWEADEWGFEEEVETTSHDYYSCMYQFHIKAPLIPLNGQPAILRPTLDVWFLDGKYISKMPHETWEKLNQVLDSSYDYTYMWSEYDRNTSPRIVVITPYHCATSVHMVCTIRNTLVAIIVWEFVRDLWDVIPLSNTEDRLWLTSNYFVVCLEHNSLVMKHLLRRSWFEFLTFPWYWLRQTSGKLRRFIENPSILRRAMEI